MKNICKQCNTSFEITDEDLKFYDKVSPIFGGKKYQIPPPTLCPDCRQQRRLSFRNERNLHNRVCDLCHKNIVSVYSPDKHRPIYCSPCWHSDLWDGITYGQAIHENESFFHQFNTLFHMTPIEALFIQNSENSEYTNLSGENKDCYLIFSATKNENCYYARSIARCQDCVDINFGSGNTLCYECDNCHNCYNVGFSQSSYQCRDSVFLYNCVSCSNCFGCTNLHHKQYYIDNEPYSRQEYERKRAQLSSYQSLFRYRKDFDALISKSIHKANQNINVENTLGDYLTNCKNCHYCYEMNDGEDCKYCDSTKFCKDLYDVYGHGINSEIMYEVMATGLSYQMAFSFHCDSCRSSYYSAFCKNSTDLFGCVGLNHKQYCILNKQYTKEEYEKLVPKIIEHMMKTGEWGEFFPPSLSPLGYNETVAMEYYPLTKEEALSKGFNWSDYEPPLPQVDRVITREQMKKLPDNIKDIPDDILNWVLTCEVTGKPYRIIKQELAFYREQNIPIPRRHPDQRHKDRMALRNPRKLYDRTCNKCNKPIKTTYAPDRPEIVYCGNVI